MLRFNPPHPNPIQSCNLSLFGAN